MSTHVGGTEPCDKSRLSVIEREQGFEFTLANMWVNVYLHRPPNIAWNEEKKDWHSYVRYYPEFSILVVQR